MQPRVAVMELRDATPEGTFEGYLSRFGEVDAYGTRMRAGCFTRTLQEKGDMRTMLWQHDTWEPIGVLACKQDDVGLRVQGRVNLDVQRGKEVHSLIRQGAVRGLSQGFNIAREETARDGVRDVLEVDLWEGSPVTFPGLPTAQIDNVRDLLPPGLRAWVERGEQTQRAAAAALEARGALRRLAGVRVA